MQEELLHKILKKQEQHDKRFDAVDKRFEQVDQRFDAVGKRFDVHDKRFDDQERQIDVLALKVLDIDERLENMATKDDFRKIEDKIDQLVGFAKKKDEELTFMGNRVDRIERHIGLV